MRTPQRVAGGITVRKWSVGRFHPGEFTKKTGFGYLIRVPALRWDLGFHSVTPSGEEGGARLEWS
jgi:hypothetical protein